MPSPIYKFTDFTFDENEEKLCKNGELLPLNPKTLRVLALLLENAGNVVTKEDFFEQVWTDSFVEDNNLTVAIAAIRKALGETRQTKFIQTVPKKGYRFVAEIEKLETDAEVCDESPKEIEKQNFFAAIASRKILISVGLILLIFSIGAYWQSRPSKEKIPLASIAVLPFTSENSSPDQQIFAEKLTQDLIFNLGRITDTQVFAFEAVQTFNSATADLSKITRDLKVDGAVTGKIQTNGDKTNLEITIRDLRNGETIFSNKYSINSQDLAQTQYILARDVAHELGKNKDFQPNAATTNFEAYQTYLQARHHLGKATTKDYEKAVENFTNATLKDDKFADAHSGLAIAHIRHGINLYAAYGLSASRKSFPSARDAAKRALELNPNSDEALTALAVVNYQYEFDWKTAESNFKKAVEINPNNFSARRRYGDFLHKIGRFDEGFAQQKAALAIEPNSARILNEMAWGAYLARRFDEAVSYIKNSQYIDKTNAAALYNASEIYEHKGEHSEAMLTWKEAMTIEAANRRWIANLEKSFQKDGYKGFVQAKTEWLERLVEQDFVYPTDLAKCHAALGNKDKALEWLKKAVESKVPDITSIKHSPAFDNLRDDARFQNLLQQLNFLQ